MHFKQKIGASLAPYYLQIEKKIEESILSLGPKTTLRDACAYALKNGGKRFRPALVLMIAKALGGNDASDAAIAVEFFHTASLIADDLPCMDNDDLRRDQPALHKAFNETIALLSTYALISAGYERIRMNAKDPAILPFALENATLNTGIFGATGGQYLDLYPPSVLDEKVLLEVLEKKTGTLFELSFVFGWLFGGGEISSLPLVKKAAAHFGTAFQIVDDFFDYEEDRQRERKINAFSILGEERAFAKLELELQELEKALGMLDLHSQELLEMVDALKSQTAASSSS